MSDHMFIGDGKRATTTVTLEMRDIYKVIGERLQYFNPLTSDPDAFCQNVCCDIEKLVGIYPNVACIDTADD